jgi:hypothetical protein
MMVSGRSATVRVLKWSLITIFAVVLFLGIVYAIRAFTPPGPQSPGSSLVMNLSS